MATSAQYWAESAAPEGPLERFAESGEITDATVAALQHDLALLEQSAQHAGQLEHGREWTTQTVVGCLLAYAESHLPRDAVPGWPELRNPVTAARLFARSSVLVQELAAVPDELSDPALAPDVNLFEALGAVTGLPPAKAVAGAVEALSTRLFADPALVATFRPPRASLDFTAAEHRPRLQEHMRALLSAALGSADTYQGRGTAEAHARLGITDDQFNRVLQHTAEVLDGLGVPPDAAGAVGADLAPLRSQVVTG